MSTARKVELSVAHTVLIAGAVVMLIPFLWMVSTSLKQEEDIFALPVRWLPTAIRWANYSEAVTLYPFGRYVLNTMIITAPAMIGTLLSNALVGYGFARKNFAGKRLLFIVMLSTMMIPGQVTMIPVFILYWKLGWFNTFKPLIVPAFFAGAFTVFLLRQFFLSLPVELEDAAKVDGASSLRVFWQIALPLTKPALSTIAIFSFIGSWDDFFGPLLYIRSMDKYTLALGLQVYQNIFGRPQLATGLGWAYLMAVSMLAVVPVLIVFFIFQKHFVKGIVLTGLKA